MLEHEITHAEVERMLNDRDNIIVLHRLDGDIWGASIAATDIFGYSNEELRQMCLVNIRPKALRLSDVRKDKMGDDAFVVFQKRNNRRFSASVKRSFISFVYQREPMELVCLHLSLIDGSNAAKPRLQTVDPNELTQFVEDLKDESRARLKSLLRHVDALTAGALSDEQRVAATLVRRDHEQLSHINENIVDSFRLAQNALSLDNEPFNIIEFLSAGTARVSTVSGRVPDLVLSPGLPELVYGDRKMMEKVFRNLADQVTKCLSPESVLLSADFQSSTERESRLLVKYLFEGCRCQTDPAQEGDLISGFLSALPVVFAKHVLRLMDGFLRVDDLGGRTVQLSLELALAEVHDLGLARTIDFLKGRSVVLVDKPHSPLATQLRAWGAQLDHFHSLAKAAEYIRSGRRPPALLIVRHQEEALFPLEDHRLDSVRTVLIGGHGGSPQNASVVVLPLTTTVPEIGNILSQALLGGFPYPYCHMSAKRRREQACDERRFLVVSHDGNLRSLLTDLLREMRLSADEAINGIDAVMASTNLRYDGIIVDESIPYMDGVEAAIHLRRVSHVNKDTPVLIITGDDSENAKLTRTQAGIHADIMKPVTRSAAHRVIEALLAQSRSPLLDRRDEDTTAPVPVLRRQDEQQNGRSHQPASAIIDEQVLDRLAQDTSIDVCKEMIDLFIRESLVCLGEISKCCIAGDWEKILEHAHSLRSSCRTFGCEALYVAILQLEEESRKGNMGECMRLATKLPTLFLNSQQHLYDYCSLQKRR